MGVQNSPLNDAKIEMLVDTIAMNEPVCTEQLAILSGIPLERLGPELAVMEHQGILIAHGEKGGYEMWGLG